MTATRRSLDERGTALLLALGLTAILGAIAAVVAVTARAETLIAGRFHQAREAHYAAEGALARALQDLASAPEWDSALAGAASSFRDGDPATPPGGDRCGPLRALLRAGLGVGVDPAGREWRVELGCRYTSVATLCVGARALLATGWCAPRPLPRGRLGRRRPLGRGWRSIDGRQQGRGSLQHCTRSRRGPSCRAGSSGTAPRWGGRAAAQGRPNAVVARDSVVK